ncbi:AMP-binding protein [Yoonia sediminilitoris]|uniref:Acetyl-CoA synthetase n=1 Tax=Yoonia sediminilitoris TaxID=1286148 RepID=A0A2T6KMR2_9RHOB|nr:AMP-binding protein [Yoonia sediminilitoris]PUB17513.1 acetyl-CoA synthetase [Yoonia sediminilitoris]RCW97808.1 acetyl-CoA synthetase [Yoonia sediminilitoris]
MLIPQDNYAAMYDGFAWNIPTHFNIGVDICDSWAARSPDRTAIIDIDKDGRAEEVSFRDLKNLSNQLANALARRGITAASSGYGDRVGVLLPQRVETAAAHIAVTKMGCISIPLFTLFGEDALLHRLRDSGAKAVITDRSGLAKLRALRTQLPDLTCILSVDGADDMAESFASACAAEAPDFTPVNTRADDPALLIYTSGTTGNPKGALHAHRVLLGHLPGVEMSHNFLPHDNDRFWTPADWAWIGGLLDVLMPSLHHGITVVARRFEKFDPAAAFALIKDHAVQNIFLPPTAMKIMRQLPDAEKLGIQVRSVGSGGEALGPELTDWCHRTLGTTVNEFYGQTECNMIVSSCSAQESPTPGAMGRPVPGHRVEIIDETSGDVLPEGQEGAIAVLAPDPVMFLEYWNNPQATAEKFVTGPSGKWLLTGDRGIRNPNGTLRFVGRDDDVIGSAGYRIGPAEIEDCLLRHPAVALAGAVAKPDDLRGAVVAVYLKLTPGCAPSDALAAEIAQFVKTRLAAHEYPRAVRFIEEMPMTTTGKIIRGALRKLAQEEYAAEQAKAGTNAAKVDRGGKGETPQPG